MVLAFLFFPFLTFLYSLKNPTNRNFRVILVLMFAYLGMVVNVYSGGDMERYMSYPFFWRNASFNAIFNQRDYVLPFLAKLFSYISISPNAFATFIYTLLGLLYVKSFNILIEKYEWKSSTKDYLFLFGLLFVYGYAHCFSVRYSGAALFYTWCLLEIELKKNKKFHYLIFITPLIHYSYWVVVFVPIIHKFLSNKLLIVVVFFIASFALQQASTSYWLNDMASRFLPESTSSVVSSYTSEEGLEYMNNRDESGFSQLSQKGIIFYNTILVKINVFLYGLMILVITNYKRIKQNKSLTSIFTLLLLYYSMANIASSGSRGDRFYHVGAMIVLFFIFSLYTNYFDNSFEIKQFVAKNRVIITLLFIVAIIGEVFYTYGLRSDYNYFLLFCGNPFSTILYWCLSAV